MYYRYNSNFPNLCTTTTVVFSYYNLPSWNISSPRHSWISTLQGPRPPGPSACTNFQLMVYKLRWTLLEYLSPISRVSTVFINLQMSGDSQRLLGDYSENISERSPGISERFPGIQRFVETVERYSKSVLRSLKTRCAGAKLPSNVLSGRCRAGSVQVT